MSNTRHTKSESLISSRLVLQLFLLNPLKQGTKSRIRMQLEQHRQAMVENEDFFGAAPMGNAPTTSEWSTLLLHTKVRLLL